ncbi:MAG: hypothetical protein ACXW1Y_07015, partial [Acidimicrobiia bacterium]
PLVGRIPLDEHIVSGGDQGTPVVRAYRDNPSARAYVAAARRITELVPPAQDETCTARVARLLEALDAPADADVETVATLG